MTGGTLIVSRSKNHLNNYKEELIDLGYKNVTYTFADKEELNFIIGEQKPNLVMMEACYYDRATPYMMRLLLDIFPDLNIAAVNRYNFPDDTAMRFIFNGCNSYVNLFDGLPEFEKGILRIRDGLFYVSPNVQTKINMLDEIPEPVDRITMRRNEVIRLISCGYNDIEIAKIIHITKKTVINHKWAAYKAFDVDNPVALFWAAESIGLVTIEECRFFQRNNPQNKKLGRKYTGGNE